MAQRGGDPYADQMNAAEKYVASRTLTDDDMTWNSKLLSADNTVADVVALRDQAGGDLVTWGSASLVTALLANGLVDELTLMIEPILEGDLDLVLVQGYASHLDIEWENPAIARFFRGRDRSAG